MNDSAPMSDAGSAPPARRARAWKFWLAIGVLVCLFAGVLQQRNRIRAHWWAAQLARGGTDDPDGQAYYLASLAAVGDVAAGAVEQLADDERSHVRALAVVALAGLPNQRGLDRLRRLMGDADAEVADSAALSLAFMTGDAPLGVLVEAATAGNPRPAVAAAAALARVDAGDACHALCTAVADHPDALVRAQAVESLGVWLLTADASLAVSTSRPASVTGSSPSASSESARLEPVLPPDPVEILVTALSDQAAFRGWLSLERQITAAKRMLRRDSQPTDNDNAGGGASPERRTVARIAADSLAMLTGIAVDHRATRTAAQVAELAALCRRRLAERRAPRNAP